MNKIPLQIIPFGGSPKPAKIDMPLGTLPPNYVHTFVLDLKNLPQFRFGYQQWVYLDWASGDRVTIIGGCGKVLKEFSDQTDFFWSPLVIDPTCCAVPDPKSWRIYLVLETGSSNRLRAFSIQDLEDISGSRNMQALLLGDDLGDPMSNLTASPIGQAIQNSGKLLDMWAPWHVGNPQSSGKRIPSPTESVTFDPADGWILLSLNFTDPSNGFFSLVYYNLFESRLRFYLLNDSLTQTVTGYRAEIRLESLRGADGYNELTGAFFPIDTDPANWSVASVLIGDWAPGKWTYFEFPVLYPMAESLPIKTSIIPNKPPHHYYSLYEEQFCPLERNVRVVVSIKGYLEFKEELTLEGEAVCHALHQMEDQGIDPLWAFKEMYNSIKTGVEWYQGASGFVKGIEDYITKNPNKPGIASLKTLVNMGTALSPAIGLAGALVSFSSLLDDNEPLRLAIDLSLKGIIQGTSYTEVVSRESWFFLPGHFSIAEAFNLKISGTPATDGNFLARIMPRHGTTIGLFGYQFNPSVTRFPIATLGKIMDQVQAGYIFPARKVTAQPIPGSTVIETVSGKGYRRNIAGLTVPLLPVIYNPYGMGMHEPHETLSSPVLYLSEGKETIPTDGFTHILVKVLNYPEIPASTFAVPTSEDGIPDFPPVTFYYGDKIDASQGFMLEFIGHYRPQLYSNFIDGQVGYLMTRNPSQMPEMDKVSHKKIDRFVPNDYHIKAATLQGMSPHAHQCWHIVFTHAGYDSKSRTVVLSWPMSTLVNVYRFRFQGNKWSLVIKDPADKEKLEKNIVVA